jgi:hypothetical protein
MSEHTRIPRSQALQVAEQLLEHLSGTYARAEIAGSIRRGKDEVGDIEIVLTVDDERFDQACDDLVESGVGSKRLKRSGAVLSWGVRYKALWFCDTPVDLFIVRPDRQWGVTMLLRTGPGDANRMLVTARGQRTRDGLPGLRPPDVVFRDGCLFKLPGSPYASIYQSDEPLPAGTLRLNTPDEASVFSWLQLPFTAPENRSVETYGRYVDRPVQPVIKLPDQVEIGTARLGSRDPDSLEVTVAGLEYGRVGWPASVLVPLRNWLNLYRAGEMSAETYRSRYLDELRWRWVNDQAAFLMLLAKRRLVLTCYCSDANCHRHWAKDVLLSIAAKRGVNAVDLGELAVSMPDKTHEELAPPTLL